MNDLLDTRTPNPVDLHVGARIRLRRRMQGVSQEKLADALGLTFQQVQKYERGANRVSASKLYEIAAALKAPVAYFFDGLADPTTDSETSIGAASDEQTVHATRAVRSALHGFVTLEAAGGFGLPQDVDESYNRLVELLDTGLRR